MKPIKLQDGLWAVDVPEKSYYHCLDIDHEKEYFALDFYIDTYNPEHAIYGDWDNVILNPGRYEILGTVTQDEISFDVEGYLEKNTFFTTAKFTVYDKFQVYTPYKEYSFRSLLSSKGLTDYEKLIILKEI